VHLTFIERVEGLVVPKGWMGSWEPREDDLESDVSEFVCSPPPPPTPAATAVLGTFPDVIAKIASVSFNGIGSFWPSRELGSGQPVLGGLHDCNKAPIKTFAELVSPKIRKFLAGLRKGTIMVRSHYPDILYLSQLELLDLVNGDPDMSNPEPMYLEHGDGWQFMFDFEYTRIKSILDWDR
jgi:hypothetical protein